MLSDLLVRFSYELEFIRNTNFSEIRYINPDLAIWAAVLLIAAIFIQCSRVLYGRNKKSQLYSGHLISEHNGPGRFAISLPFKIIIGAGLIPLFFALADPFLVDSRPVPVQKESKERIEMIDGSVSMGFSYKTTGKSLAEIVRDYHLKFLKMREGKNDRVALWIFSENPKLQEGFIVDDLLYRQQVEDAPYILASPNHSYLPKPGSSQNSEELRVIVPIEKVEQIPGEGGTNLAKGLEAVIRYSDLYGNKKVKKKAVLVITDAMVDTYPEDELRALRRRNTSLYMIYIRGREITSREDYYKAINAERLKKELPLYGGRYYDIENPKSLQSAYEDIDRLEAIESVDRHVAGKIYLFQRFIFSGLILLAIGIALESVARIAGVYP